MICKYFLSSHRMPFTLLIVSFAGERFQAWFHPTYQVLLLCLCFQCHIQKPVATPDVKSFSWLFQGFYSFRFTCESLINCYLIAESGINFNLFVQLFSLTITHSLKRVSLVVKNLPANAGVAGDTRLISELGTSPGVENGNPLQYSCLGNPMDREVWCATVHGASKVSDTTHQYHPLLKRLSFPLGILEFLVAY